jgi:propanol-preferring alcohol dehydrogenase
LVKQETIPGHQIIGTVDQIGSQVKSFRPGQKVGVAWLGKTCGKCAFCRNRQENLCEHPLFTGYHTPGGFAEYTLVDENFAYLIPEDFDEISATPLLCAGIIGYRALKKSRVPDGGKLGLYGFGSSAHIVIQLALARRCEVYVCSRGKNHQALAKKMGASWVGESHDEMPVKLDSAIIFAPAGELVPLALKSLKKGGTLALAGIYMTDIPAMNYTKHLFYEKNICSVTANTREDGRELFQTAAKIKIKTKTQTFPLTQANYALQLLKQDKINGSGVLVI